MLEKNPVEQRHDDLRFLSRIIRRGRTTSMYEGSRLLSIANLYPVEIWYLCEVLNKPFYDEIAELTAAGLEDLRSSLN
jgi:hypothetical protein